MPDTTKDMTVRFHMAGDDITVDDLIALEEGSMSKKKAVLAKMVVTPQGNSLYETNPKKAFELVGKMTLTQLNNAADQLADTASNASIPKDKGTRSG